MQYSEILKKVQEVIVSISNGSIKAEDIQETSGLKVIQVEEQTDIIGLSSMELVEMLLELEDYYHITITEEEFRGIMTVGELVKFISEEIIIEEQRNKDIEEVYDELFGEGK